MMVPLRGTLARGHLPLALVAGAGVCASLACEVNVRDGKASFGVFAAEATDEWTHHHPLAAGGRVEIVNLDGPVELSVGPVGSVEVHATITAKALTEATARDILSKGKIQEIAEPARVHVETVVPRGVHGSYEVRYEVRVPGDAQADISTTNGSLKANGLAGSLKVTAVNGRVELDEVDGAIDGVVTNRALTVKLARVTAGVRLEATHGRLSLELAAASGANLSARVVNGSIAVSELEVSGPTGRRIQSVEAALNGGGPELSLRATNGRIRVEGK